jgi:hypothetical protein
MSSQLLLSSESESVLGLFSACQVLEIYFNQVKIGLGISKQLKRFLF